MRKLALQFGAVAAAAVLTLTAQQPQPQMLHITIVSVNPGMGPDYEDAQKNINDAHKKQGTPWRDVWTNAIFGEPGYVTVFPVGKMARYDSQNPMRAAMNDMEYARYLQRMSRIVRTAKNVLVRTRPELSIRSNEQKPNTLAVVTTLNVPYGKQADFENFVKGDLRAAWQKSGVKDAWVHQTVLGGATTEYVIVALFEKWAEMEGGSPLERTLGPTGMLELRAKGAGLVTHIENRTMRRVEALSYVPAN